MTWPIVVTDCYGHTIYMTEERWQHAKLHPGMDDSILPKVLSTLRTSKRRRDGIYSQVFIYQKGFPNLPLGNRQVVVAVKFEFDSLEAGKENNFVLTAYLRH